MNKILVPLSFLLIAAPGALFGQNSARSLTNVKVASQAENTLKFDLEVTEAVKYHIFRVSSPPRLVIELIETAHAWQQKEIEVVGHLVEKVRSAQYKSEPVRIVRVVMDMATDDYTYKDASDESRINISLQLTQDGKDIIQAEKKEVQEAEPVKIQASSPEAAPAPAVVKARPEIKPNIPTPEHRAKLRNIIDEKSEREGLMQASRQHTVVQRKEVRSDTGEFVPGSLVGSLSSEMVEFNFIDAEIKDVLRAFAVKLNKNIIPASGVSGSVSLRLRNVPFDEAFHMLLSRMKLVAIQRSPNVIEIVREEMMPTDRRTFRLRNRIASDISDTLRGLLTPAEMANTTLAVDRASNSMIITATPSVLNKIDGLVRQMDIKSPQIKIKARIIEVMDSKDSSKGVSWMSSIPWTDADELRYSGFVAKDASNFTTTWDATEDRRVLSQVPVSGEGGFFNFSAMLDDYSLSMILNFLATQTNSKTVSEPTIMTENNQSARIHVGRNLPVRTTRTDQVGYTQTVEFITEGVDLQVTPVVSPGSDQVALEMKLEVSEFIGFQADMPITTGRSANTQVTVQSGKTIVIGGLIRERATNTDSGIPILKDIPLLGYLFKNKTSGVERNELLVFLTPEIIAE